MALGPRDLVRNLEKLAKELDRSRVNALRRSLNYGRGLAVEGARKRGIGRKIWGKKASGARTLITVGRVKKVGNKVIGTLRLKGLAALVAEGGRTKPYEIKARPGKRLAFKATGGRSLGKRIAVQTVHHKGGPVPAEGFHERAIERTVPRLERELELAAAEALRRAGIV